MFTYNANVTRVIDGDTIVVDIDLGFTVWLKDVHVRLNGINTPELHATYGETQQAALKAKARVEVLTLGKTVQLTTVKANSQEKYGRWLGNVSIDGIDVNAAMIAEGLAKPWNGQGVRP